MGDLSGSPDTDFRSCTFTFGLVISTSAGEIVLVGLLRRTRALAAHAAKLVMA
jgi:hypothetical protein